MALLIELSKEKQVKKNILKNEFNSISNFFLFLTVKFLELIFSNFIVLSKIGLESWIEKKTNVLKKIPNCSKKMN